jgi:hypothetical protein
MNRRIICIVMAGLATLASACAETDPYKRRDPDLLPPMEVKDAVRAYSSRWPDRFKCVQTVTIDFGPVTRTLVGYLLVQTPYQFRLQGMTEQGVKLFDIAGYSAGEDTFTAAEEFDKRVLANIARDIRRVFLDGTGGQPFNMDPSAGHASEGSLEIDEEFAWLTLHGRTMEREIRLTAFPPAVDRVDARREDRALYRIDQYEWTEMGGELRPSVIVLRERGVESNGPSYKLTIQITSFEAREEPWPSRTFELQPG